MIPPVVDRELRASGRHWTTYWLRVVAGLSLGMLLFLASTLDATGSGAFGGMGRMQAVGRLMLSLFHTSITVFLMAVGPVLTADTLARERGDGTLGLLFLTPLLVRDILLGKVAAQLFRALALWLAMLPFLAVPFLMGSITPENLVRSMLVEFSVLLAGLAAGLMATVRAVRWSGAVALAFLWAAFFYLVMGLLAGLIHLAQSARPGLAGFYPEAFQWILDILRVMAAALDTGDFFTLVTPWMTSSHALSPFLVMTGVAMVLFFAAVLNGAQALRRQQRLETLSHGASPRSEGREKGPRERRVRRCSTENPVIWLHAVKGGSQLTRWWLALGVDAGWFAVCRSIGAERAGDFEGVFVLFGTLMVLGIVLMEALFSAGSYRQELEEGSLEILLVTPLRLSTLISGQWFSVVGRTAPVAVMAVAGPVLLGYGGLLDVEFHSSLAAMTASTVLTLPLVGLRCAMRRLHPVLGWILTLCWGVVVPFVIALFLTGWVRLMGIVPDGSGGGAVFFVLNFLMVQTAAAMWWGMMTEWDLRTRAYQLKPLQRAGR